MVSKKLIKLYTEIAVRAARKIAEMEVNTSCPFVGFQPEIPDSVKKLSKVKNEERIH